MVTWNSNHPHVKRGFTIFYGKIRVDDYVNFIPLNENLVLNWFEYNNWIYSFAENLYVNKNLICDLRLEIIDYWVDKFAVPITISEMDDYVDWEKT